MKKPGARTLRIWVVVLSSCSFLVNISACVIRCNQSGVSKTVEKNLPAFNAIEISGVGSLEIKIGDKSTISISAGENVLPTIHAEVEDNQLKIWQDDETIALGRIKFVVTTPTLNELSSSGATAITASGLRGAKLEIKQSGVGSMELIGAVEELSVKLSGTGSINAFKLIAQNANATLSGIGRIQVYADKHLKASVTGAGSISYRGQAELEESVSGVGSISKD